MLCLPLEYLNGWLFGINATRVKKEIRENLIRYQAVEQQARAAEQRTRAGALTEEQAREIQHRVNLIAQALTKHKPDEKHHMGIYEALRQETGATSYKNIPMKGYEAALAFLENWLSAIERTGEQD